MAFGTVAGSAVQWASVLGAAQTPNWYGCGVGAKPRAWSALNPSWPVSTTVNPQPEAGVPPSAAWGTLKLMPRESAWALMLTVPAVAPCASVEVWPKPCTSLRRLQHKRPTDSDVRGWH